MNSSEIRSILRSPYNRENWKNLYRNIFQNKVTFFEFPHSYNINEEIVESLYQIGYATLDDEYIVALFEVNIKSDVNILSKKIGLRKVISKYISDDKFNGVLTIFENGSLDYRFTFASKTTKVTEDGIVVSETESKRYTYILGGNEPCLTPSQRFEGLFKKNGAINLDDIKEAFSVEKLNKEFFNGYKEHYELFCNYLYNSDFKISIFSNDEKNIRDYVKKFLGRIVFLYFVQKKGWLGVKSGQEWGLGDHRFLSNLFNHFPNKNKFYSKILSRIFFEYLSIERTNDIVELFEGYKIRIPYLNGGLFEKDIVDDSEIDFFESDLKSLFEFFDRFNFTIYEDDPNEHTVAVDPEMLGHIFENLLEDNKDKGAFYTPKEIVHYMCQESLIEYLTSWFQKRGYEIIGYKNFIQSEKLQLFSENESRKGQLILESTEKQKIDRTLIENLIKKNLREEDKELILKYSSEFNESLDKIKVCDPAIGSGAFPMGLLQEIFLTKQSIWNFEYGSLNNFPSSEVKLNIIQNSIYGVDIEKGAVDIARLRFWLSLIVDEESPKSLPNLDYKIIPGNSLLSSFNNEIIEINWNLKFNNTETVKNIILDQQNKQYQLEHTQHLFFQSYTNKENLKKQIKKLKIEILENQILLTKISFLENNPILGGFIPSEKDLSINLNNKVYVDKLNELLTKLTYLKENDNLELTYFDWRLNFPEIFNDKISSNPGFDIVIGNPPYVNIANISDVTYRNYLQSRYKTVKNKSDLYSVFIEKSESLLSENGKLCFIFPKTWMGSDSFSKFREFIINNFKIYKIVNLGYGIFENATVSTVISIFSKESVSDNEIDLYQSFKDETGKNIFKLQSNKLSYQQIKSSPHFLFSFEEHINFKIKTLNLGNFVEFSLGIKTSEDSKFILDFKKDEDTYPMLRGKNIRRYNHDVPKEYIWYKPELMMKKVGAGPRKLEYFTQKKILIQSICNSVIRCTLDYDNLLVNDKVHILFQPKKYTLEIILGILNSKLMSFISRTIFGNYLEIKLNQLALLPFPLEISNEDTNSLQKLVNERFDSKNIKKFDDIDNQIDLIVYKIYKIDYNQILYIDNSFSLSSSEYELLFNQ
jgi:adenine-specific DNA-methyltransferase